MKYSKMLVQMKVYRPWTPSKQEGLGVRLDLDEWPHNFSLLQHLFQQIIDDVTKGQECGDYEVRVRPATMPGTGLGNMPTRQEMAAETPTPPVTELDKS